MKKYVFEPYSNIFPKLFEEEKRRILAFVKEQVAIEHIGSTAVLNLGGKGIIDIAIAVEKKKMNIVSKQLQDLGYEFRPNFSTDERFYFIIYKSEGEDKLRRYHMHLTYTENSEWTNFLSFRDYLREHREELEEYEELKHQAALIADNNGASYRRIKEPFFKKIRALINQKSTI